MQVCMCGAEPGYPHDHCCPYPLYRGTRAQEERWLADRATLRGKLVAEAMPKLADAMERREREGVHGG